MKAEEQVIRDRIVRVLNEALEADEQAISNMLLSRVVINSTLAEHPTIQCGTYREMYILGPLGLINGFVEEPVKASFSLECKCEEREEENLKGKRVGDTCSECNTQFFLGRVLSFE